MLVAEVVAEEELRMMYLSHTENTELRSTAVGKVKAQIIFSPRITRIERIKLQYVLFQVHRSDRSCRVNLTSCLWHIDNCKLEIGERHLRRLPPSIPQLSYHSIRNLLCKFVLTLHHRRLSSVPSLEHTGCCVSGILFPVLPDRLLQGSRDRACCKHGTLLR